MSDTASLVAAMQELVRDGQLQEFVVRAHDLDPADLGDVLASLTEEERLLAVQALPAELAGQALAQMPEEAHAGETLAALDPEQAAEIVEEMDDDEAADLLGELEPADQERILSEVEGRADVERLLEYDPRTAGGIMTSRLVAVVDTESAREAMDDIRRQVEEVGEFYQIFVTDGARRLVGVLPLKDLVVSPPDRPVREIMAEADVRLTPEMDQEEVAHMLRRYDQPSLPVVDAGDG